MRAATILLCGTLLLGPLGSEARAAKRAPEAAGAPAAAAPAPAPGTASSPSAPPPPAAAAPAPGAPAGAPSGERPAPAPGEPPPPVAPDGKTAAPPRREAPGLGLVLRGGYFGLPDVLADALFRMHPKVDGYICGAEFRYHGAGGGRSVGSVGLAIDRASTEADGLWQTDEFDEPWAASGKIDMTAVTVTAYANILPSWAVHPYVGLGIGAAYLKGSYRKDDDLVDVDAWFPAVHIPVGLAVELGDRFMVALEGRFIDGIAAGGLFQLRF